jgi:hypothetical protein
VQDKEYVGGLGGLEPLHRYKFDFTEVFLRSNPLQLPLRRCYEALQMEKEGQEVDDGHVVDSPESATQNVSRKVGKTVLCSVKFCNHQLSAINHSVQPQLAWYR